MQKDEECHRGSTEEKLGAMVNHIYQSGEELSCAAAKKIEKKTFVCRRDQKFQKLRKEKKDLRKRWIEAGFTEKEGLTYENLKKKCRQTQRNIRRIERSREIKKLRGRFLKAPYERNHSPRREAATWRLQKKSLITTSKGYTVTQNAKMIFRKQTWKTVRVE